MPIGSGGAISGDDMQCELASALTCDVAVHWEHDHGIFGIARNQIAAAIGLYEGGSHDMGWVNLGRRIAMR